MINSVDMTVSLPADETAKILELLKSLLNRQTFSIRELSRGIGMKVATFPAIPFGRLHYRGLERQKIVALDNSFGDYGTKIKLNKLSYDDLRWWIQCLPLNPSRCFKVQQTRAVITTDASLLAWGAVMNYWTL